ncbi:MAG TPA: hypothetical protein VFQ71_08845 [Gaiellales bacterium]|nr:hypothetical protein [Gaiellales bacterium]
MSHGRTSRRRRAVVAAGAGVLVEAAALRMRAGRFGGHVPVRCRAGHLYTTIWIPGGSLKALRLGWWRVQRCPVGGHWSLVTPLRRSELSDDEARAAAATRDIGIP